MERKEMVKKLSEHLGVKAKYLGAPSFNYQIEIDGQVITIDRDSTITLQDGKEVIFEDLVGEQIEDQIKYEVSVPMENQRYQSLKNLCFFIYSKQSMIKKVFEVQQDIIPNRLIEEIMMIEDENLEELTEKINEISNGLRVEQIREELMLIFDFFGRAFNKERLMAYSEFVLAINQLALESKRASSKITATDNEKYTFRVFLIRLGLKGNRYKETRKILLENLEGNSAFR